MSRLSTGSKISLLILSVLLVLALAVVIGWHQLKSRLSANNPGTKAKIGLAAEKSVIKVSDSLYRLSYSDFHINIDSGFLQINNMVIKPNEEIYHKLLNTGTVPCSVFLFEAKKIIVDSFQLGKADNRDLVRIKHILIDKPVITIRNKITGNSQKQDEVSALTQVLKELLHKVGLANANVAAIDSVTLREMRLVFINANGTQRRTTKLNDLTIQLNNVDLVSQPSQKLGARKQDEHFTIAHAQIATADHLYLIDINKWLIDPANNHMEIGSIALTPRLSKLNFYKAAKRQNARFQFTISDISIHMDFKLLLRTQQFHIPSMSVGSASAEIYTNYNWPLRRPPLRRKRYPHDQLQQLAFDVTVDTINASHSNIYFRIAGQKSKKEAVLSMENLRGHFFNITNNETVKKINSFAKADIETQIMGTGSLKTSFLFSLTGKDAPYKLSATLGPVEGSALNPLIGPLSLIEVKAGNISKMDLTMKADEYSADGNVDLFYKGLKINMLKHDVNDSGLHKLKAKTIAANLILPNDNPGSLGHFRKGPINTRRDARESFLGFMWRSMLDGLTTAIIGFDQHKNEPHNIVTTVTKPLAGPDGGEEKKAVNTDKQKPEHKKPKIK